MYGKSFEQFMTAFITTSSNCDFGIWKDKILLVEYQSLLFKSVNAAGTPEFSISQTITFQQVSYIKLGKEVAVGNVRNIKDKQRQEKTILEMVIS